MRRGIGDVVGVDEHLAEDVAQLTHGETAEMITQHRAEAVDLHRVQIRLGLRLVVVKDFLADRSLALQKQEIAHQPQLAVGGERAVTEALVVAFGDVPGADHCVEAAAKAR